MVAKLIRTIQKIAIQLHLVAESCTICSSRSRWPVRELSDTPSYEQFDCSINILRRPKYFFFFAQVASWIARSQLTSVQVSVCVCYSADTFVRKMPTG
jgi:hypothetical protein